MFKDIKIFTFLVFLLYQITAVAALDMELTKGIDSGIPIAIVPFAWEGGGTRPPQDISDIVASDLQNSGRFDVLNKSLMSQQPRDISQIDYQYWIDKKVEDVAIGNIQSLNNGYYKVSFSLVNLYKGHYQPGNSANQNAGKNAILAQQEFTVETKDLRRLAHHISDIIYQVLTGERGVFSTKLAYISAKRATSHSNPTYFLEISDIDGYNAISILRSSEPIMSPSWSPDAKKIAYVSFEGKRPKVYISDVITGKRELITSFPGINGAPAWSPNGQQLAVALSKGSNPNIYVLDLITKSMRQLTHDQSINTEPSWSPNGKSIIFTSDRGGTPQIYQYDLQTGQTTRVTFDGSYNATASYTSDGKYIVLLHRSEDRLFNIAIMDVNSGVIRNLTPAGMHESPSVAPNGRMVVYSSNYNNQAVLGMVSTDGKVRLHLPDQQGSVQEPVWSPFLT